MTRITYRGEPYRKISRAEWEARGGSGNAALLRMPTRPRERQRNRFHLFNYFESEVRA